MSAIGDARDLQQVLNSVYAGAVKECEGREHEGKLTGNGHHMAQAIVENVKIELLQRGLFVKFDGPVPEVDAHEQHAQAFLTKVREIFVDALKLSPETSPDIFGRVAGLVSELRHLFRENTYVADREFKQRLRGKLDKLVNDL